MLLRRETPADVDAVRRVTAHAFSRDPRTGAPVQGEPPEVRLLDRLRTDPAWLPALSWVALDGEEVVGHGVCSRAHVDGRPVVVLGPIGVEPSRQRAGIGSALMHALIGAADALEVPLIGLVGDPAYYARFGFGPATALGVLPPDPAWGVHFQARPLSAYSADLRGTFHHARVFDDVE